MNGDMTAELKFYIAYLYLNVIGFLQVWLVDLFPPDKFDFKTLFYGALANIAFMALTELARNNEKRKGVPNPYSHDSVLLAAKSMFLSVFGSALFGFIIHALIVRKFIDSENSAYITGTIIGFFFQYIAEREFINSLGTIATGSFKGMLRKYLGKDE